jgi:FlaA1/EpsC-like NDP-sugar epimerase
MSIMDSRLWKLYVRRLIKPTHHRRALFFLTVDVILIALSMLFAFMFRFDWIIPQDYLTELWISTLLALAVKIPMFYLQGLYHLSWPYVSVQELLSVLKGVLYSSLLIGTAFFVLRPALPELTFPRSILFIDFLLTLFFIGGFRLAKRIWLQFVKKAPLAGKRTLIVGAGDAGEQLLRSTRKLDNPDCFPIGFVDDDPVKKGTSIQGVRVLGTRKEIPELVKALDIEELLIAIPSSSPKVIKETVELGRKAKLKSIKVLPDLSQLLSGKVGLADVREVQPEDLFEREQVRIDTQEIEKCLRDKSVMVTGAAGSIGSELCRQISKFHPKKLIMLDHEETGLFDINRELADKLPRLNCVALLGDVKDSQKIRRIFTQHSPEIIFHAAAYKHVGMMKENPDEAIKNNVFGTKSLGEAAIQAGTERLILISTDKAVNPVGIMGMSKRAAELVIQELGRRGFTKFSAVRFGNVIGSRGSVIPIFKEQISHRGPVTVTDPDMRRYFMTISEAVLLVLQAAAIGKGGEVFVLDMGEPVSILELAREMIHLSGYEPDKDIPISIIGAGDDEKIFEDILTAEEGSEATQHEKIFTARMTDQISSKEIDEHLHRLKEVAYEGGDTEEIKCILQEMIFGHKNTSGPKDGGK